MISLRQRVFITVSIISASIIVIILAIFVFRDSGDKDVDVDGETQFDVQTVSDIVNQNVGVVSENIIKKDIDAEKNYVKQNARIFVERFFTYSNQNDNKNIDEIKSMIVKGMEGWINSHSIEQSSLYEGVTTRVLSSFVEEYDLEGKKARVLLGVEQTLSSQDEGSGIVSEEVIQKEVFVDLVKQGSEWKISGVWWQE